MIVISDTSCLCYLARLGQLDVLHELFGDVFIPPVVAQELALGAGVFPEIDQALHRPWIVVRALQQSPDQALLMADLDPGETEAIALARELHADYLIVDDLDAREVAQSYGLRRIGLLGVFALARQRSLVGPLQPLFAELVDVLGFRASPSLIRTVLKQVGE